MQKLVVLGFLCIVILIACSKDNIETTPAVEIKSINPMQVPGNTPLEIMLSFTDKQGDLDSLFLKKLRINSFERPTVEATDTINYKIPEFPEKSKGEIRITLDYNLALIAAQQAPDQPGAPNGKEPDTLVFKFIVMDKAKNLSDTVTSDPVVVERF
jgi:hypothetical protein